MTEAMISKIIELETLTPLFIKGKDLDYGEGMLRGSDGFVYLIDNDKLCEYIANKNKVDEYAEVFGNPNNQLSLKNFLRENGILPNLNEVKNISCGITNLPDQSRNKNTFVQNGNGKQFLPGSSLKGAIRNAVLWKILTEPIKQTWFKSFIKYQIAVVNVLSNVSDLIYSREFRQAQTQINQNTALNQANLIKNNRIDKEKFEKFKKNYTEYISKQKDSNQNTIELKSFIENPPHIPISDSFDNDYKKYLNNYNERWKDSNNTLRDFFRLVKISDANFVTNITLKNKTAKAVCKDVTGVPQKNHTYQKKFDIKLECVPKAIKAQFKITIDTELAKAFFPKDIPPYLQSIEELLKVVNDFFRAVAKFEDSNYYDGATSIPVDINPNDNKRAKLRVNTTDVWNVYKSTFGLNSEEILFRTGWGGGFMSKTQFLHLDMADRIRVRDMILPNGSSLAPKSRCLIVEGEHAIEPLGWCKLTVFGDAKDTTLPSIDTANIRTDFLTEQSPQNRKSNNHFNRRNPEKPITEKEIQQLKAKANALFKQAVAQTQHTTQLTYTIGKKVSATVKEFDFLKKIITVKIGNQIIEITTNQCKPEGETVTIEITKVENGQIKEAKLLKGKL